MGGSMRLLQLLTVAAFAAATLLAVDSQRHVPTARAAFPGANGKIAFVSDRDGNHSDIFVMDADGSDPVNLTNRAGIDAQPAWSPDGSKIAFASNRDGDFDIYVMNGDGTHVRRITDSRDADLYPAWSPDGRTIAIYSSYGGDSLLFAPGIYTVDLSGNWLARLTDDLEQSPAWAPDGTTIAYEDLRGADVYVMNADGTNKTNLTGANYEGHSPNWSPDGTRIAFVDGQFAGNLLVMSLDATDVETVGVGANPAWSPDGSAIAFQAFPAKESTWDIFAASPAGGAVNNLTTNPSHDIDPDWQPLVAGDANCADGIDAVDTLLILEFEARLIQSLDCADLADVNNDSSITSIDALLILQYVVGYLDSLPP